MSEADDAIFGRRVLILVPHPDDEVVGAAHAIERLIAAGGEAFGAYLTTGVPPRAARWFGNATSYARAVETRWQEATRVRERLGMQSALRRALPARSLKTDLSGAFDALAKVTRRLEIDRIWTPAYEGGHQDHDAGNFLAAQLAGPFSNQLRVFEFAEYNYAGRQVQSQNFPDSTGAETRLELDAEARLRKQNLLSLYASERRNLGAIRFEHESFRPLAEHDYRSAPHAGPLFYERFHWVPFHPRIDFCRPHELCAAFAHYCVDPANLTRGERQ